jgi:Flp pilus assembly protein TadB
LPASNGNENLATAVTEVSERFSVLVREEIELAKTEMAEKASSAARGAGAIAAGAVFGVFALVMGLGALAWGLNSLLSSLWLGFLIVFAILLVLTVITFLLARRFLKVGAPTPTMAIDEAKKIRETVSAKSEGEG